MTTQSPAATAALREIKSVALKAGAPGELRVPLALSRIVRLCIDALAAPAISTPSAWMRGVHQPSTPDGPGEYEVDLAYGEDCPDGDGWVPLYRSLPVATSSTPPDIARLIDVYGMAVAGAPYNVHRTIARAALERAYAQHTGPGLRRALEIVESFGPRAYGRDIAVAIRAEIDQPAPAVPGGGDATGAAAEPAPEFSVGDQVEKYTGDYRLAGEVRAVLTTKAGKTRYVVEHMAVLLHIYGPSNLRQAQPRLAAPGVKAEG